MATTGLLQDRVAIVTGAGRGIGASVARLLAREGASVVVNDLGVSLDGSGAHAEPAELVQADITRTGGRAISSTDDISNFDAAGELVRRAIDTFGRLDVLINAAGILRDRMIFNLSEDDWDAVVRVHLKGSFNTVRHAAAYWRGQRNPDGHYRLINFTSASGLHGSPGQPNYAAAKMGIVGLTYSCANALQQYGVTANAVSPGAATRMTQAIPPERRANPTDIENWSPDNVAPAVAFLASMDSDWCTGQVISAEGLSIGLYETPRLKRTVTSARSWNLEDVLREVTNAFRPVLEEQGGRVRSSGSV